MRFALTTLSTLSNVFVLFIFANYIAVKFKWISSRADTGMALIVGMIMFGFQRPCYLSLYAFTWWECPTAQIMSVISAISIIAWLVWAWCHG